MNEWPVEDSWLSSRNDDIALSGKGSFTIIDIYESVHSVRFLMTPSPLPKSVL